MIELLVGLMLGFGAYPVWFPPEPQKTVTVEKKVVEYCGHCIRPGSKIIDCYTGVALEVLRIDSGAIETRRRYVNATEFRDYNIYESIDRTGCFFQDLTNPSIRSLREVFEYEHSKFNKKGDSK